MSELRTVQQEQALFHGMKVSEVAAQLKCDESHVQDLIRSRKLRAINIGLGKRPVYRVNRPDLEQFLKDRAA